MRSSVKVSGKIFVDCELPSDYGMCRMMTHDEGLPLLSGDLFYVLTKNKEFVIREYQDDGFSFVDTTCNDICEFIITGYIQGGMGVWCVEYRVSVDSGKMKNVYETRVVIDGDEGS